MFLFLFFFINSKCPKTLDLTERICLSKCQGFFWKQGVKKVSHPIFTCSHKYGPSLRTTPRSYCSLVKKPNHKRCWASWACLPENTDARRAEFFLSLQKPEQAPAAQQPQRSLLPLKKSFPSPMPAFLELKAAKWLPDMPCWIRILLYKTQKAEVLNIKL